jgi:quercetin dioxygenase-like cupin family protein
MSSTTSNIEARQDAYWWQAGLMEIKARAEDTGGALGVVAGTFYHQGYGAPLHVHSREDEAWYVLEGQIRFRTGDDEFVAGPGTWVWQPRGVPHAFKVESERARALFSFTPGGLEGIVRGGRRAGRGLGRAASAGVRRGGRGDARKELRLRGRRTPARVIPR